MDIRQLKDILRQDIEELQQLHDRISDEGEALSVKDKQSLRFQLSGGWLTDMYREQRSMFAEGAFRDLIQNHKYIMDTLTQLS